MIRWSRPLFYASLNDQSRPLALAGGTLLLTSTLANRLFITSLEQFDTAQSQADILTVVGAATLVLYGLGRVSVQESKESVDVGGVDVHVGFETDIKISKFETGNDNVTVANPKPSLLQRARNEAQWISKTLFASIPSITSFAVLLDGTELCRAGRFRSKDAVSSAPPNGIAANSLETGKRAYLADMKVVPVKEVEFGFLPEKCQVLETYLKILPTLLHLLFSFAKLLLCIDMRKFLFIFITHTVTLNRDF